jgi:catechol 2,3-dioxygenase-like lactoylglutathione lyase family enzyme
MSHKGFSHIGLSTLDLDRTREFYEGVLGFKAVRCDTIKVHEGGTIRHIFFDAGRDQLIAFMEARGVPGSRRTTTRASRAGSACRAPSTTSPSRRARRRRSRRSATS